MADFPPATGPKEDSKFFRITRDDNIMRTRSENGIEYSRPRTTRRPVRLITTGFTFIEDAEKDAVEQFYLENLGSSFTYDIPVSGETIQVKFQSPIEFDYDGVGPTSRWNSGPIQLREEI